MIVGVPRESFPGELRVALTPAVIPGLAKAGLEVVLESGGLCLEGRQDSHPARRSVPHSGHHRSGVVLWLE